MLHLICSNCGRKLGCRRFAPPQVRCGRCDTVLRTDLLNWNGFLGPGGKLGMVIKELFIPSWLGVRGLAGFAVNVFVLFPLVTIVTGMISLIPMLPIMAISQSGDSLSSVMKVVSAILLGVALIAMSLGLLAYPLLLTVRLVRMIRESNTYERTKEPPTW